MPMVMCCFCDEWRGVETPEELEEAYKDIREHEIVEHEEERLSRLKVGETMLVRRSGPDGYYYKRLMKVGPGLFIDEGLTSLGID